MIIAALCVMPYLRSQVRETDLDALEAVVGVVAYGDVDAEAPGSVAEHSLRRLLRLSQLAAEYLLHVQEQLATERCHLQARPRP